MRLFAYGSLKDPVRLAAMVGRAASYRVLGAGTVQGVLYDLGPYPALQRSDAPGDRVPGLLLELDDAALAPLDAYEDVAGGQYVRESCAVTTDDGRTETAWIYIYNRSTAGRRRIRAWPPESR